MALLETDAVVRRAAHQRLRDALRLLTGTRSFHNFCPHFHDSSDGALHIVSMQRYYYCLPVLVASRSSTESLPEKNCVGL